ncbi:hypothetical protein [Symbiopectobacterium sp. RP]
MKSCIVHHDYTVFREYWDIARVESLDTGKKLVHLIDREGDSIGLCAH